ncbi:hypothetical protein J3R30DRAFT_3693351 [Lentinula aciculospora]|uniref:Uncharacterized protein n=1 Tax=Lentinula aciculospora TaxID=153920 RepID=A0A9W9DXU0_9AGAR|nr:hypothetical protein J3R30DRAFT_3693351 [Lentinula aciculospora]
MPSANSLFEERAELLDKLMDLPLKGDATPSSGITSLPTPHADDHPRLEEPVETPRHETAHSEHQHIIYPTAPRIKDLDSFTEGTGGSFDFLADEVSFETADPLNSLSLSLLEPQEFRSIELWREDVFYNSPNSSQPPSRAEEPIESDSSSSDSSLTHSKRPRSVASDDVARRTKPRAQSMYSSPYSIITQFYSGVEPPTADVRPFVRPQLRRTRSLPLRPD